MKFNQGISRDTILLEWILRASIPTMGPRHKNVSWDTVIIKTRNNKKD